MKRVLTSVLALALLVTMVLTLASCGAKPKGKYGHDNLYLEFDGDKVSVTLEVLGVKSTSKGTYTLDDDNNIKITYENEDSKGSVPTGLVYNADKDTIECKFLGSTITLDKID